MRKIAKLSDFRVVDGSFVHAVISAAAPLLSTTVDIESGQDASSGAGSEVNGPRYGFDRLGLLGLSVDEIAAFRANFRANVDQLIPSVERRPDEENSVYRGED